MWNKARAAIAAAILLTSCRAQPSEPQFPKAHRDVAPIVGDTFSTEDARDRVGEAEAVMQLAGVKARNAGRRRRRRGGLLHRPPGASGWSRRAGCWPRTSFPRLAMR